MKKSLIILVIFLFLSGCQNKNDDMLEKRAQEIIRLAEADGFKDMKIISMNDKTVVISQKDMCDITATFKDKKLVGISTKKNGSSTEEYSCVMRTLIRDSDFLGTDEEKNKEFLNMFRDKNNFEFNGLSIEKDDYSMKITRIN